MFWEKFKQMVNQVIIQVQEQVVVQLLCKHLVFLLVVSFPSIYLIFLEDAEISAIGGMGNPVLFNSSSSRRSWKYGGGGGGRIFLRYERLDCSYYDAIVAFGGPSNGGTRGLIGGAGTITHIITNENQTVFFFHSMIHI